MCGLMYVVLYVNVTCVVVRECTLSRRYKYVRNYYVFSVVNMLLSVLMVESMSVVVNVRLNYGGINCLTESRNI